MTQKPSSQKQKSSDRSNSEIEPQEVQPESGFIDREERMEIRQSSPTNPRVSDKPEVNQEEA